MLQLTRGGVACNSVGCMIHDGDVCLEPDHVEQGEQRYFELCRPLLRLSLVSIARPAEAKFEPHDESWAAAMAATGCTPGPSLAMHRSWGHTTGWAERSFNQRPHGRSCYFPPTSRAGELGRCRHVVERLGPRTTGLLYERSRPR